MVRELSTKWPFPLLVAVCVGFSFLPAVSAGFVNWDDDLNFLHNHEYRGLRWQNIKWMFTTYHAGPYQPLSWMSLGLDYQIWGLNPFGYHLTNVALHVANSVLFYFVSLRLLQVGQSQIGDDSVAQKPLNQWDKPSGVDCLSPGGVFLAIAASASALLFGIHPLRAESVAWITERRDVLAGLFFLCTILSYVRAARTAERTVARLWRIVSLCWFTLSVLSKAITMTAPLVLLILDVYPLRRLRFRAGAINDQFNLKQLVLEKSSFLVVSFLAGVVAIVGQYRSEGLETLSRHGLSARVGQAIYGLASYPRKTLAPVNLIPLYRFPDHFHPLNPSVLVSAAIVLGSAWLLWRLRRRLPYCAAAAASYVVLISPVLGFAQSGAQIAADRYSYFACMPWAILGGAAMGWCIQRLRGILLGLTVIVSVFVLATLGLLTWKQCQVWHDSVRLWEHTLAIDPQSVVAHYNLGFALEEIGQPERATEHYRAAIRLDSSYVKAHNNLAGVLSDRGELEEAASHFESAVQLDPRFVEARFNLANTLASLDRFEEAAQHYDAAIVLKPDFVDAHINLGILLASHGYPLEAIDRLQRALALKLDSATIHYHLGSALLATANLSEAVRHFQQAIVLEPESVDARYLLGVALAIQQQYSESARTFYEAREIAPENIDVGIALAWLLATCPDDTVRDGKAALRIAVHAKETTTSGSPQLLDALAAAYAEVGQFTAAVETANQAADFAAGAGQNSLASEILKRVELYESHRPYRDQPPPATP